MSTIFYFILQSYVPLTIRTVSRIKLVCHLAGGVTGKLTARPAKTKEFIVVSLFY